MRNKMKKIVKFAVLAMMLITSLLCFTSCEEKEQKRKKSKAESLSTPLTLEAIDAGAVVTFKNLANGPVTFKINGGGAKTIESGQTKEIQLGNAGDAVSFYGDNATYVKNPDNIDLGSSNIACSAPCYIYGNIMSLVDSNNFNTSKKLSKRGAFCNLFRDNKNIKNKDDSDLLLPATELTENCYAVMFSGCANLINAPKLPAKTLAEGCYKGMFQKCTSLEIAPELPATMLAENCYYGMFLKCEKLTKAPSKLPATTLAEKCYNGMFTNCSSLEAAPELPATTLAENCYYGMFSSCKTLQKAPKLPATTLAKNCYCGMFNNCENPFRLHIF